MYKKNNGSTEQEILQNQFSAYVKKAVHNRRIQFLTEKSRKFRFETPLFDLDYLLFDTTDIIQEITDHETVRQALRSIKENERRIVLERIIEEKSFGQLSDELGMSYQRALMVDIFDRRAHHILHLIGTENAVFRVRPAARYCKFTQDSFIHHAPTSNKFICVLSFGCSSAGGSFLGAGFFLSAFLLDLGADFPG